MYNLKRKKNYGVMFHHFHDHKIYSKSPGSIDINQLEKIIQKIGRKNIINPNEYLLYKKNKTFKKNYICLTFDDGIKSQLLALKILKKHSIKAFFFINTKYIECKKISPEVIRFFIYNFCKGINKFYKIFIKNCNFDHEKILKKNKKKIRLFKVKYKFYSDEDINFRIIRNNITQKKYHALMEKIMKIENFDYKKKKIEFYLSKKDLIKIDKSGHMIGLHTHSHPNDFSKLNLRNQREELLLNIKSLREIFKNKKKIFNSFSYPGGNYSYKTLKMLKKNDIKIAFTNSNKINSKNNFEIPRINHKYLI